MGMEKRVGQAPRPRGAGFFRRKEGQNLAKGGRIELHRRGKIGYLPVQLGRRGVFFTQTVSEKEDKQHLLQAHARGRIGCRKRLTNESIVACSRGMFYIRIT